MQCNGNDENRQIKKEIAAQEKIYQLRVLVQQPVSLLTEPMNRMCEMRKQRMRVMCAAAVTTPETAVAAAKMR